jgi:hypothetical protein
VEDHQKIVDALFEFSSDIRYVAILQNGTLTLRQREHLDKASSGETDRFEELVVNPSLLTIARHRGNIDCGGLRYMLVGYGNFFQLIKEINGGHLSVCLRNEADVKDLPARIFEFLESRFANIIQMTAEKG